MSAGAVTFAAALFLVSYARLAAARSTTIVSRRTTPTVGRPSIANVPNLNGSALCAETRSITPADHTTASAAIAPSILTRIASSSFTDPLHPHAPGAYPQTEKSFCEFAQVLWPHGDANPKCDSSLPSRMKYTCDDGANPELAHGAMLKVELHTHTADDPIDRIPHTT